MEINKISNQKNLIIKSIELMNIAIYENAKFEFGDNINIIIGENGFGKSTLYKSLKLGLYGEYITNEFNRQIAFNNEIKKILRNNTNEGKISILLLLKNREYLIERILIRNDDKIKFKTNIKFGDGVILSKKQKVIFQKYYDQIIATPDLEFFFLDGEDINEKIKEENIFQEWVKKTISHYLNETQLKKILDIFSNIKENEWKYNNISKDDSEKLTDLSSKVVSYEKKYTNAKNSLAKVSRRKNFIYKELELLLETNDIEIESYLNSNKIIDEELIPYIFLLDEFENQYKDLENNLMDIIKKYLEKDFSNNIYENPLDLYEKIRDIISKTKNIDLSNINVKPINLNDDIKDKIDELSKEYHSLFTEQNKLEVELKECEEMLAAYRKEKIKIDTVIHEEFKKNNSLSRNMDDLEIKINRKLQEINVIKSNLVDHINDDIKNYFSNYHVEFKNDLIYLFENSKLHNFEQISAGEKQVITNIILKNIWKISNFTSTIYYDTPMGRLDKRNKDLLSKSFFEKLESQILIFSTDEEFTKERILEMENVDKVYKLSKNRDTNKTEVVDDSIR